MQGRFPALATNLLRWKASSRMTTREDIESYLIKMAVAYEELSENTLRLRTSGVDNLILTLAGPIVVFRLKVITLQVKDREKLFETLLRLNNTELLHCAFGLEGESVVLGAALELENLDFNEFQAVVDDMTMAVSKHLQPLSKFQPSQQHPISK
jgi:hypothetical protein